MLYEALRKDILSGRFGPPKAFPSEMQLMRRFKLSRITVRRALDELGRQGFITSRQGAGTYVTRLGAAHRIGLIMPGIAYSEFYQPLVGEILHQSASAGYELILNEVYPADRQNRRKTARQLAKRLIDAKVAGVIYQPLEYLSDDDGTNQRILEAFDAADIPVVLIDSDIEPPPARSPYDLVSVDNVDAGERLARHLLEAGAKRIHFQMRARCYPNVLKRMRGAFCALMERGRAIAPEDLLVAMPNDLPAIRRHMSARKRPDAIICESDTSAAELKLSLDRLGFSVPDDIQLTGFDDIRIASLVSPPLTTIHQPCADIARTAFHRLLARIANPALPPTELLLPSPLVVRASTRRRT